MKPAGGVHPEREVAPPSSTLAVTRQYGVQDAAGSVQKAAPRRLRNSRAKMSKENKILGLNSFASILPQATSIPAESHRPSGRNFVAVKFRHGVGSRRRMPFIALFSYRHPSGQTTRYAMNTTVSNTNYFALNLTDRSKVGASGLSSQIGIDKMRVTFPVNHDVGRQMLGLRTFRSHAAAVVERDRGGAARNPGFSGYVYVRRDATYWGSAEFNPSRWHNPEGWECLSVTDLPATLEKIWPVLETAFEPSVDFGSATVTRLDIARDFVEVPDADKYLKRLDTNVRSFKNLYRGHHASPTNGGWTLRLSTKTGGSVLLYDKHRESAGRCPEGTLRFEVQMEGWLTRYGSSIRTVSDITPESVEHAAREWWNRSNFGLPIASDPDILDEVQALLDGQRNAATMANAVFAYYLRTQSGDEASDLPPSTRRRYESILRRAEGFRATHGHEERRVLRLDLESGKEVDANG